MNKIDLAGRAGIVTGGARGIGYAIAERMLASGAKVALWDVDAPALEKAAGALKPKGTVATATAGTRTFFPPPKYTSTASTTTAAAPVAR